MHGIVLRIKVEEKTYRSAKGVLHLADGLRSLLLDGAQGLLC